MNKNKKSNNKSKSRLCIIYEDRDIIVIDKPARLLSVSTSREARDLENTAFRMVNDYVKKRHKSNRIFIVHRLDRETSGVMLFAKSEDVKLRLQNNWDSMAIKRGYVAVVEGKVKVNEQKITSRLKQTTTFLVYSSNKEGEGKLAITNYRTLETANKYSLLSLSLETGRKNQIRVHMKDIGHPIAGDKKYGSTTNPLGRTGLHASVLVIKHPVSGKEMTFESAIPDVFMRLFNC